MASSSRSQTLTLLSLLTLAGAACVSRKPVAVVGMPARVALLPFDNETVNMAGPDQVRRLVAEGIAARGFALQPSAETDERLKALGITDGGQLKAYTPQRLAEELGVEGLFYGVLEQFTTQNVGVALRRAVALRLELVDAGGRRVWEAIGKGTSGRLALQKGEARKILVEGLAEQAIQNALRAPLMKESKLAVDKVLRELPRGGY